MTSLLSPQINWHCLTVTVKVLWVLHGSLAAKIWNPYVLLMERTFRLYIIKTPWPESASELYRQNDRRFTAKLVTTFANRGFHVVSVTDLYDSILGFLDFLSSSSSVVLKRLNGSRSRHTTSQKIWLLRESNPDLWSCSQELWPLDHRGGPGYILSN
jgi:hypothetical protein